MPVVLEINTKDSLFEPVEVKIDGEVLRVKPMTIDTYEKIIKLDKEVNEGSFSALRRQMETLLEGNLRVLGKLTLLQTRDLMTVIINKSIQPGGEEKNGPGLGENATP